MTTSWLRVGEGRRRWLTALGAFALFVGVAQWGAMAVESSIKAAPDNQYVGAKKCKSCHESAESGNQYGKWTEESHSKAFATLSGDKAKEVAKGLGIEDPSKSEKCLSCHVTGHGEPANHFASSYEASAGVGCETCHGPGQKHAKARLAASDAASSGGDDFGFGDADAAKGPVAVPAGEIIRDPGKDRCLQCHNDQSPTFKPFDYDERHKKIAHKDPRRAK